VYIAPRLAFYIYLFYIYSVATFVVITAYSDEHNGNATHADTTTAVLSILGCFAVLLIVAAICIAVKCKGTKLRAHIFKISKLCSVLLVTFVINIITATTLSRIVIELNRE